MSGRPSASKTCQVFKTWQVSAECYNAINSSALTYAAIY
jgi:hypothetical protein